MTAWRDKIALATLPRVAWAYLRFTALTSSISVHGAEHPDRAARAGKGLIYAFWHNRQILLHDFDVAGQERLQQSTALVVGLGGLGCPAALYLAAAGVGRLLLADGDEVELSNLQRQIAHGDGDIGGNKAQSAAAAIAALNPAVELQVIPRRLQESDLSGLLDAL